MTEDNQAVTRAVDEVMAENTTLKAENTTLKTELEETRALLKTANDFIENRQRSDIIVEVKKSYNVDDTFIAGKSTAELKRMVELTEIQKAKVFKSSNSIDTITDDYDKAKYRLNNMFKFAK
jgi:hypothetical protein